MGEQAGTLALWMRRHVTSAGAKGLVVGLSGGVDSAVVARLCQLAMPGAALGVLMPCHSQPDDERDAMLVADHFALPTIRVELGQVYDALVSTVRRSLHPQPDGLPRELTPSEPNLPMAMANVKPRLRMTTLYFVANSLNCLVAGTGNRSEITVGYFTKYGDGGTDLLPLGRLLKSQVRALARDLGVPTAIIDKPPSAGLWVGQTDEDEMGFTYDQLEAYLGQGPGSVPPALALRIERLIRTSEHKRVLVPMPEPETAGHS